MGNRVVRIGIHIADLPEVQEAIESAVLANERLEAEAEETRQHLLKLCNANDPDATTGALLHMLRVGIRGMEAELVDARADARRLTQERDDARADKAVITGQLNAARRHTDEAREAARLADHARRINDAAVCGRLAEVEAERDRALAVVRAAEAWHDDAGWLPYLGPCGTDLYRAVDSYREGGETP